MKITVIGAGNIGSALVEGLLMEGSISASDIILTDISIENLASFAEMGVNVMQSNVEACKNADMIVICVKPHIVKVVMEEILPSLTYNTLLISFAAGVSFSQLHTFTDNFPMPVFRAIPNTAMSVCQSMTCISASENVTSAQRDLVLSFFSRIGKALFVDESLMDAATVLASCGTAFALRYLRAATEAGVETGFNPTVAKEIVAQTMLGAAVLITGSGKHPEIEIDKVTTPGGLTIKGLNQMEHAGFSSTVVQGILAAFMQLKNYST